MSGKLLSSSIKIAAVVCVSLGSTGLPLARVSSREKPTTAQHALLPTDVINDPAHHAIFSCLIRNTVPDASGQPTTLRLYLDSGGDIYPAAEFLPAATRDIRWPGGIANQEADLQWYFDRASNQPIRDKLFALYGVAKPQQARSGYDYDNVAWDALRRAMAKQLAGTIDQATGHGNKPLVVLVHGYNVADYEHALVLPCGPAKPTRTQPYYATIREALLKQRPELRNAVWLEVYWDGLQNSAIWTWGAAQASARYAGLGLREVLRQTDARTPVRVFTHSAGGIVISQALWNNNAFEDATTGYGPQLMQMMKDIPTPPHRDIRVGMLVPALTSEAFMYYSKRTPASQRVAYRIVVGQNRKDFAVSKGPFGCSIAGATCMGGDARALIYAQDALGAHRQELQSVNFCVTPANGGRAPKEFRQAFGFEKHDWGLYFKRDKPGSKPGSPPIAAEFLQKVLD